MALVIPPEGGDNEGRFTTHFHQKYTFFALPELNRDLPPPFAREPRYLNIKGE